MSTIIKNYSLDSFKRMLNVSKLGIKRNTDSEGKDHLFLMLDGVETVAYVSKKLTDKFDAETSSFHKDTKLQVIEQQPDNAEEENFFVLCEVGNAGEMVGEL